MRALPMRFAAVILLSGRPALAQAGRRPIFIAHGASADFIVFLARPVRCVQTS